MMIPKVTLRMPRKLIWALVNILREIGVVKVRLLNSLVLPKAMNTRRVRYTAVKNEQTIPMISVVAKPLIGPVPNIRRMIPVITEVRLESKIAENALE